MKLNLKEASDIQDLNYVEFISLLRETNRCPGGKNTIRKIIQNTFIDSSSRVLEIGSNTGFTSLEIARTVKCKVIGIDPVPAAVEESLRELASDIPDVQERVDFRVASAYDIPFDADSFDMVATGGATSFMKDKDIALKEYHRVLKPWGFLAVANLCYLETPPADVVKNVSRILGVDIPVWTSDDWMNLFQKNDLFEIYHRENNSLSYRTAQELESYVAYFMRKDHIQPLSLDVKNAITERWYNTLEVFNKNHKYLGFILTIFRKRFIEEEPELFSA